MYNSSSVATLCIRVQTFEKRDVFLGRPYMSKIPTFFIRIKTPHEACLNKSKIAIQPWISQKWVECSLRHQTVTAKQARGLKLSRFTHLDYTSSNENFMKLPPDDYTVRYLERATIWSLSFLRRKWKEWSSLNWREYERHLAVIQRVFKSSQNSSKACMHDAWLTVKEGEGEPKEH